MAMTYEELNQIKTMGFTTNHIIDDAVSSVIFEQGRKHWRKVLVSDLDMHKIMQAAKREGVTFPLSYQHITIRAKETK